MKAASKWGEDLPSIRNGKEEECGGGGAGKAGRFEGRKDPSAEADGGAAKARTLAFRSLSPRGLGCGSFWESAKSEDSWSQITAGGKGRNRPEKG